METWSSRRGFILAAVGSAVGLGNVWRFPAVLGQYGGAYLLPYFIVIVGFVLPLLLLELAVGRHLRTNAVGAFRRLNARFEIVGWLLATIVFTILSYYLVIAGWTLAFLVRALAGGMLSFSDFTSGYVPVLTFIAAGVTTGAVTSLGVRRGIERVSTLLMPLAFIILGVLAVYSFTLSGFREGMEFMFSPDFSALTNPRVWSAALGQALFSLSVGYGILLTYGSYVDRKTDLGSSGRVIAAADVSVALLASLAIFPIVFTIGLEPSAGAELAFVTLPTAFEEMRFGLILAPAFFGLLFVVALTSSVSMLELNVAAVTERTGLTRRNASIILTGLVLMLGLPSALSYSGMGLEVFGWPVLDLLDDTVGRLGLPIGALLIAFFFTRWLPQHVLRDELGATGGPWTTRRMLVSTLRWPIPIALLVVVGSSILATFDPTFLSSLQRFESLGRAVTTVLLGAGLLVSTLVVITLLRRWRAQRDEAEIAP